jgi:hypothetical protein
VSNEVHTANTVVSFPFVSILTIVFIVLKLTNVIDWSWWWVLSPLWIGALFVITVFVIIFIIAVLLEMRH